MRTLIIIVLLALPVALTPKSKKGEGDEGGRSSYEIGMVYRLSGDETKSREHLEKAAASQGRYADLARLELIRLVSKDPAAKERAAALRAWAEAVEDERLKDEALFAASSGLFVSGALDESLAFALEIVQNRPASLLADDALLLSAEIFFLKRAYPAVVERLLVLTDRYPASNSAVRAWKLLARVYGLPGEYESPGRARFALLQAEKIAEKSGKFPDAGAGSSETMMIPE